MAEIPMIGNLGIDITIALIAGGAVTTWLTLLFDRTSKRRQEYLELSKGKISKIGQIESRCLNIGTFLRMIARLIDGEDVYSFMYFVGKYLKSWWDILESNGYIQLDDLYSEDVILKFAQYPYVKLKEHDLIGLERLTLLVAIIKAYPTFSSFKDELLEPNYAYQDLIKQFKDYLAVMKKDTNKQMKEKIKNKAKWYYEVLQRELALTYQIYYGKKNVKGYFTERELPQDLLDYLDEHYPQYLQRLLKFKLA